MFSLLKGSHTSVYKWQSYFCRIEIMHKMNDIPVYWIVSNMIYKHKNIMLFACIYRVSHHFLHNSEMITFKNVLKFRVEHFLPASPKAKAGLGVQSLRTSVRPSVRLSVRPSVRPSRNLVIATPLKLLIQLSWNLVCR